MPGAPRVAGGWRSSRSQSGLAPVRPHRPTGRSRCGDTTDGAGEGHSPAPADVDTTVAGRLIHKADFESLMAVPIRSRSAHFAVHHLARAPGLGEELAGEPGDDLAAVTLSTRSSDGHPLTVDNMGAQRWLGAVVPKRHARRAVTRNLLKRQIRAAFRRREEALPAGLWLVRLRRPFTAPEFVSARSRVLAETVRAELEQLLLLAATGPARTSRPAGRAGPVAGASTGSRARPAQA